MAASFTTARTMCLLRGQSSHDTYDCENLVDNNSTVADNILMEYQRALAVVLSFWACTKIVSEKRRRPVKKHFDLS